MAEAPKLGDILTGRVTATKAFGAFVALEGGQTGLIHISELSGGFVKKVEDFVTAGDEVRVKVVGVADDGKINLSMKALEEPKPRPSARVAEAPEDPFETMMNRFKKQSEEKLSDLKKAGGSHTGRGYQKKGH